jgi:UDP-GlcNAc:undecaprenyl-phosphate GlcNAc-1-phosphate transferase
LALFAYEGRVEIALVLSLVAMGAVTAFLMSNAPLKINRGVRCFMGDSGSTLVGFVVAWLMIVVSQVPTQPTAPVTMLWVIALPLYELIWTIIRRVLHGTSPLAPDNLHLHHLLMRAGFDARGAFAVLVALAALLAVIGVVAARFGLPESWSLSLLVVAGVFVVRLMYRAERLRMLLLKLQPVSLI